MFLWVILLVLQVISWPMGCYKTTAKTFQTHFHKERKQKRIFPLFFASIKLRDSKLLIIYLLVYFTAPFALIKPVFLHIPRFLQL